ncbi:MAG: glycosyltransferase family 4 protein [Acidimicrobiales bacterium]
MRVAYTLEQCWHRVPGGTGSAAVALASALLLRGDVEVIGVAGRHRAAATEGFAPPVPCVGLPLAAPWLYETWTRFRWPLVESVVTDADVVHSTSVIPAATRLPHVVTLHDVAFLLHPEFFTSRGNRVFRRSLGLVQRNASLVLCSSRATLDDCLGEGFPASRLRHVPLGVSPVHVDEAGTARVREKYSLPAEFVLFVGTLEPRKNLDRLIAAMGMLRAPVPLVIAGIHGWGDRPAPSGIDVRMTGWVDAADLPALYAASSVFAYPSVLEGFGMPVLEAMAAGTAVVTSRGTSTEEVAGGAAVLVDPLDVSSIARGIEEAVARREELVAAGRVRAATATWQRTAQLVVEAYAEAVRG